MKCNQIFSLLQLTDSETATYTIKNIIVASDYEKASKIARTFYGSDAIAIDTTLYPVAIGYTYVNKVFYDANGNVVESNPTEAEEIAELKATTAAQGEEIYNLTEYNAEMLYQISLLQLGITEE